MSDVVLLSRSSNLKERNGSAPKFVVSYTKTKNFDLALKRPTTEGLDTGPVMFTKADVERVMDEKITPRRYTIAMRENCKGGLGDEAGKRYQG